MKTNKNKLYHVLDMFLSIYVNLLLKPWISKKIKEKCVIQWPNLRPDWATSVKQKHKLKL